jgi:HEAT repeat protein
MTWPSLLPICFALLLDQGLLSAGSQSTNQAWKILQAGVHHKSANKRVQAVSALGLIANDPKAIETAEHALQDSNAEVRRAAVTALGDMDSQASLPKIRALLEHSDAKTVVVIAAVLKKLNDPQAYDLYYQILTGERKAGGGILDGLKDKKSLEKMGVEEALGFIPFGGIGIGAYDYFKQNGSSNANVNVAAATALAQDRDLATEKALIQASFGGKEIIQVAALRALAKRGEPSVVKDIEPAMYSEKSFVSYTAAAAVVHLSSEHSTRRSVDHLQPKRNMSSGQSSIIMVEPEQP